MKTQRGDFIYTQIMRSKIKKTLKNLSKIKELDSFFDFYITSRIHKNREMQLVLRLT
jgi:hypothetical protein